MGASNKNTQTEQPDKQTPKGQVVHMEGDVTMSALRNDEGEKLKEKMGQLERIL